MKSLRTIVVITALVISARAQTSYYASYGFGVQSPSNSVRLLGMGNAGTAVRDSMSLNQSNPALWEGFGSTSLQGQLYSSTLTIPTLDFKGGMANFSGFSFKMPVGKRSGFAIGLAPLTRMKSSVSFSDSLVFQGEQIDYSSEVELVGGISELYLGSGYRISKYLAIGLKANVIFGNYVVRNHTELSTELSPDGKNTESFYKRTTAVSGNCVSFGILLNDRDQRYNLSATVEKGSRLKGRVTTENYYGSDSTFQTGTIEYPTFITIGARLPIAKYLAFSGDLRYGIYNQDVFQNFYVFRQFSSDSRNSIAVGIGLEKAPRQALKNSFFQKLYYRCGAYYQTEPVYLNSGLREYGVTAGFSLPYFNNLNRIDFALTYGLKKGFLSNEIGNEEIFSIHLGITTGEPWFRRYKKR
ncbi:MAG: hypothetical protein M0R34_01470 [Candidatus Marinimicrobia bacterium]|jgi:hypothetical protein|nr:hypothetical protein [Candidatus Neomarinimicrobiota bacterium]MCK9559997.1 hypothetical protein [Candidatus Neomarinimicrobiota bacterium]